MSMLQDGIRHDDEVRCRSEYHFLDHQAFDINNPEAIDGLKHELSLQHHSIQGHHCEIDTLEILNAQVKPVRQPVYASLEPNANGRVYQPVKAIYEIEVKATVTKNGDYVPTSVKMETNIQWL
jgi:hypothetical protein